MRVYSLWIIPGAWLLMAMIGGCSPQEPKYYDDNTLRIHGVRWDVPPQVVYKIDDHRFISLEDYRKCFGDVFYNDTQEHLHTHLFLGDPADYRGHLIIDDPVAMNIVIPTAAPGPCDDHTCSVPAIYSTDGGRTFTWMYYIERSTNPPRDSEDYTIAVTKDRFYVKKLWGIHNPSVSEYPLVPGIDLTKPYPPGVRGSGFAESKRPHFMDGLRTPSGQDHFICDESIEPSNWPQKMP
jgi:hypothetical protein